MKPKKVKVIYKEIKCTSYRAEYQCPKCKIFFQDDTLYKNVTRFLCSCGQEIIVDRKIVKEVDKNNG